MRRVTGLRRAWHRAFSQRRVLAQPAPESHPHIMAAGEVTPGLAASEYAERRAALADLLPDRSVAIFSAAPLSYMSHDVPFPYHQDVDLLYLCGFHEHASLLACVKSAPHAAPRWHLFLRPTCPTKALWDGPHAGVEGARRYFLADGETHDIAQAGAVLRRELPRELSVLYHEQGRVAVDEALKPLLAACAERGISTRNPRLLAERLRVKKSAAEQSLMRQSAELSAKSFGAVMRASRHAARRGLSEAVLAAQFEFECRVGGAERLAYPSVVAGGENATVLHYMHNDATLADGSLMLMDAGASLHGYSSDITRTWPLSGRFSAAQRDLYAAVLDVNLRVIAACQADGTTSLNSLHRLSMQYTFENLVSLGVLKRDDPQAFARCQRWYPHAIGHWLGLDVHDTPSVSSSAPLEPGMVVTVEPGLYFGAEDSDAPSWCRGIGIRIEDDVLITAAAGEVLSGSVPKEPDAVVDLMHRELT